MMNRPEPGRQGLDMASWLARKIRQGHLHGLPLFRANGGNVVYHPEPYAAAPAGGAAQPSADPRSAEQARDDARAFRSWVEGNQLDLTPPRPTARRPSAPGPMQPASDRSTEIALLFTARPDRLSTGRHRVGPNPLGRAVPFSCPPPFVGEGLIVRSEERENGIALKMISPLTASTNITPSAPPP